MSTDERAELEALRREIRVQRIVNSAVRALLAEHRPSVVPLRIADLRRAAAGGYLAQHSTERFTP